MLPSREATGAFAQRVAQRFPVYAVWFLLGGPWLSFVYFISVDRVLRERGDILHFCIQIIIFHTLLLLSATSFIGAVTKRPIRPDASLAPPDARPLRPDDPRPEAYSHRRAALQQPSFDDDDIPLRLLRESPRGQVPQADDSSAPEPDVEHHGEEAEEDRALLPKDEEEDEHTHVPLTAKSVDHHCPWLDNCVGYHNQKYFVLFTTYTAIFALYGGIEAGYETYRFFADPPDIRPGPDAAQQWDEWEEVHVAFKPVALLLLAIMGVSFGLAVAGLACYHWFLVLNNRTTLEDMNRLPPAVLLDPETRARLESLGERGSRHRTPGAWRPDHILTRNERNRLRDEARAINVYNVGWRSNLRSVMLGDGAAAPTSMRELAYSVLIAANPLAPIQRKRHGPGHFFPHEPSSLERLKALTMEMRVGLGETQPYSRVEPYTGGEWTIGEESASDSDETVYDEAYGDRRRGRYDA